MSKRVLELCHKIGIKTFGDLAVFKKYEQEAGENLEASLERYYAKLGDFNLEVEREI